MDLTARPQPRTFWELLRCCKKDAKEDGEGDDDFHNTTSQVCSISTFDKGFPSSVVLDSPQTQSTIEAGKSYFWQLGSNINTWVTTLFFYSNNEPDFSFKSNVDEDGQIFSDSSSEVKKEEVVTREQSTGSSNSIDKEWHEQSLKAAIDNNEQNSDECKDESFDDASVILDNLTDFAEQLQHEVDTVVSNVVDALFS